MKIKTNTIIIFILLLITFILFITWFYISKCNALKEGLENNNNCNRNRWKITRNKRPQNWNSKSGFVSFMQGDKNLLQFGVSGSSSQPKISLTHYYTKDKQSPEKTYDFPKGDPNVNVKYQWIVEATNKGFDIWYNNDRITSYSVNADKFDVSNICPLIIQPTDYNFSPIDTATITVENFPLFNSIDCTDCSRWKITKATRPTIDEDIRVKLAKRSGSVNDGLLAFYSRYTGINSFDIVLTSYNIDTGAWFGKPIPFPSGEPPYEWTIQATSYGFNIIYNTVEVYFVKRLISSIDRVYRTGSVGDMTITPTKITPLSLPCSWTVNLKSPSIQDIIVWKSNAGDDMLKISNNILTYKVKDSQEVSLHFDLKIHSSFIVQVNTNTDTRIYVTRPKLTLFVEINDLIEWSNFNYVTDFNYLNDRITIVKDKEALKV